jgi:ABC-type transporter Mla MlaB component
MGGRRFVLAGDCTLPGIVARHAALREAFAAGGDVTIDLADVGRCDLSLIQLLVSAARTAAQRGTALTLAGCPDHLAASVRSAGIALGPDGQLPRSWN